LCEDLFGLPISAAQVCEIEAQAVEVLAPVMAELAQTVRSEPVVNADETGWKQNGKRCWLWVVVAQTFALFEVANSRGRKVIDGLIGELFEGTVVTDRWSAYHRCKNRQLCWAHLRRDFQALIDRGGAGKRIGQQLLSWSDLIFHTWHRLRDKLLSRPEATGRIRDWYAPQVKALLTDGLTSDCAKTVTLCRDRLARWDQLWMFCSVEGVEPTNNSAERALRPAVLWRKKSQGTRSDCGSRYVATMLSVATTCRMQKRRVWEYLTAAFQAAQTSRPVPSLLQTP